MLEYCLKQERAKSHKLKFGVDPPNYANSPDEINEFNLELEDNMNADGQSSVNWKQVSNYTIHLRSGISQMVNYYLNYAC